MSDPSETSDWSKYACCNPECRGNWGTGCYHCHHPSMGGPDGTSRPKPTVILKHGEQGCDGCELLEGMLEKAEGERDKARDMLAFCEMWMSGKCGPDEVPRWRKHILDTMGIDLGAMRDDD